MIQIKYCFQLSDLQPIADIAVFVKVSISSTYSKLSLKHIFFTVIYDNDLTEEFVKTLERIFAIPPKKTAYITLEKRYVFTLADLDTVAPCYEYFMECLDKAKYRSITTKQNWQITKLETNFPKYFEYDRCKELVLLKISLHDNAHDICNN